MPKETDYTVISASRAGMVSELIARSKRMQKKDWVCKGGITFPPHNSGESICYQTMVKQEKEKRGKQSKKHEEKFVLKAKENLFVRVTKNGKILYSVVIEGKNTVYIGCIPCGKGGETECLTKQ